MKYLIYLVTVSVLLSNLSCQNTTSARSPQNLSKRLVAIGDLHGDYEKAIEVLVLAGAVSEEDPHTWKDPNLDVVITGDLLDRENNDGKTLDYFINLKKSAGDNLIILLGNHEILNFQGDMRYVFKGGFEYYKDVCNAREKECKVKYELFCKKSPKYCVKKVEEERAQLITQCNENYQDCEANVLKSCDQLCLDKSFPNTKDRKVRINVAYYIINRLYEPKSAFVNDYTDMGRFLIFEPKGKYALELKDHNIIEIHKDNIFVHGGLKPFHIIYGVNSAYLMKFIPLFKDYSATYKLSKAPYVKKIPKEGEEYNEEQEMKLAKNERERHKLSLSLKRKKITTELAKIRNSRFRRTFSFFNIDTKAIGDRQIKILDSYLAQSHEKFLSSFLPRMKGLSGIDSFNKKVSGWLKNGGDHSWLSGEFSPVWDRVLSDTYIRNPQGELEVSHWKEERACRLADQILSLLKRHIEEENQINNKQLNPNISRIIMGHTVQKGIGVNAICNDTVWRIDVGLSHYYGGQAEVLQIKDGEATILKTQN